MPPSSRKQRRAEQIAEHGAAARPTAQRAQDVEIRHIAERELGVSGKAGNIGGTVSDSATTKFGRGSLIASSPTPISVTGPGLTASGSWVTASN